MALERDDELPKAANAFRIEAAPERARHRSGRSQNTKRRLWLTP